jgi:conjugal transfer pilus assembly protein TraD
VSSAIGSIVLADFASVAGAIYNSGIKPGRISMFVDEAAEVVNVPFIQILNKGRGAGFQVVMATQTLPDLIARTGDEAKARQIIGNCNNLITLRIKDGDTQKFVVETFGKTYIKTVQQSIGASMNSGDNLAHFSGNTGQSLTYGEYDLFPQHLLGHLPNFHYIAAIAGGRVIKGRLPIIIEYRGYRWWPWH